MTDKICYLHKRLSTKLPIHGCYRALYCRADLSRNSVLPFSIKECYKLDLDIRTLDSHAISMKN